MFWEVMGTLRWGIMCCGMMQRFREGRIIRWNAP